MIGTVNALTITMVEDLLYGRMAHSLARLLTMYNVSLHSPSLALPGEVVDYVACRGIYQQELSSLEEALPATDMLYMTRVQRERFRNEAEYERTMDQFILRPQLMTKAKRRMAVLHPLPRK